MARRKNIIQRAAQKAGNAVKAALGGEKEQALAMWQERLERARRAAQADLDKMDRREDLYSGERAIAKGANSRSTGATKQATTVPRLVSELIDAQVDSNVPFPKVDPLHPEDEPLAMAIEQMLRGEINRLPVETLNDEQERTCPIQGASWMAVEWDNSVRTHTTIGDTTITLLHPKQVHVQPGVHDPRKASWIVCQYAVTKDYVKARYGKDVEKEGEESPEINYASSNAQSANDTDNVTLNLAFYRNEEGFVGLFGWVNDTVVAQYDDYLARRSKVCEKCGEAKTGDTCACGSKKFIDAPKDVETLTEPLLLKSGEVLPAGTVIPYYRPRVLPLVLRKNISVFGKLHGDSDVDRIADQQERSKKLETKVDEKLLKGGSVLTLPRDLQFDKTDAEMKIIRVKSETEAGAIKAFTLQPNISYDVAEIERCRQTAKNILGITDSYQGLPDKTATSGVAKQIAANQSAGRLESKRRMKAAAWADVYQLLFLFKLAFADEPRPYMSQDYQGTRQFGTFNRYDFLKRDAAGEWYYEDQFFFSVDDSGGLASNRPAMWTENKANYQNGAFGQVGTPESRVAFWRLQSKHHYPDARDVLQEAEAQYANELRLREMEAQAQIEQAKLAQQAQAQQNAPPKLVGIDRAGAAANGAPVQQQARTPGM